MDSVRIALRLVEWLILSLGCWLGWQLLRQNGRILLRLDEIERCLDEIEFAEPDAQPINGAPTNADLAHRFGHRSLARSKIKRDGLRSGTAAPHFRLPRLDGRGELSLEELRGKRVLLVFSDPHCGPCNAIAPRLQEFHDDHPEIKVVMISRGDAKENRAKVKEHSLTFPIILQQHWEISRLYAMFATPIAYLVDEAGIITNEVAIGVDPILGLFANPESGSRRDNARQNQHQ